MGLKLYVEELTRDKSNLYRYGVFSYIASASLLTLLIAPVIYLMVIPFFFVDVFFSLYQIICFPVYKIEKVKRVDYFTFDRSRLPYLNKIEKINCAYCSYGNGVISYIREIAARTEQYWCPIKHAKQLTALHDHYPTFVDYEDAEAYRQELENIRAKLRGN